MEVAPLVSLPQIGRLLGQAREGAEEGTKTGRCVLFTRRENLCPEYSEARP